MALTRDSLPPLRTRASRTRSRLAGSGRLANLPMAPRPVSNPAIWSRRLALFALPVLAIAIIGHRQGAIGSSEVFWLLGVIVGLLVTAVVLALTGLQQLWTTGAKGGLRALAGLGLALIVLAPFAWYTLQAFVLPPLNDVSTDWADPPVFEAALDDRPADANRSVEAGELEKAEQARAYPQLTARRYPTDIDRVFKAVVQLVGERDWTILAQPAESGRAPIETEGSALISRPNRQADGTPIRVARPAFRPDDLDTAPSSEDLGSLAEAGARDETDERYLETVVDSRVFAFKSDVAIRIVEEGEETIVDLRAASRYGAHDLGANAALILAFMADLDQALQGISGEGG